ncbi:PP2C family serine/threonine-protein phosphatase [Cardinium endosymbiont of Nabis limbatus]|uniref:PP2C family serine/threonine-protein phosphatase n=1 Tax=Cardinium endosymbiont of Nabis limbatus TaxID=3066217 RepID=UPI003AF3EDAA
MKKYLVVLPLVASCNQLSNNMDPERKVQSAHDALRSERQRNVMSTDIKCIKSIAVAGQGKNEDSDNKNDGPVYQYGDDSAAYAQQGTSIRLMIADGLGSNWEYAAKMSSTMISYAIESNCTEPKKILKDACSKAGPAFKKIIEEVGKKRLLEELEYYEEKLKDVTNPKDIKDYKKWVEEYKADLEDEEILQLMGEGVGFESHPPATTINIATIDNGQLKWVNVGDSGLMVIRDKKIVHKSIQGRRNMYSTDAVAIKKGKDVKEYTTISATCSSDTFQLQTKDIVFLYTDGLTDNLSPGTILQLINDNAKLPIPKIIKIVVDATVKASQGKRNASGFGGKKDDITALMYIHKD